MLVARIHLATVIEVVIWKRIWIAPPPMLLWQGGSLDSFVDCGNLRTTEHNHALLGFVFKILEFLEIRFLSNLRFSFPLNSVSPTSLRNRAYSVAQTRLYLFTTPEPKLSTYSKFRNKWTFTIRSSLIVRQFMNYPTIQFLLVWALQFIIFLYVFSWNLTVVEIKK